MTNYSQLLNSNVMYNFETGPQYDAHAVCYLSVINENTAKKRQTMTILFKRSDIVCDINKNQRRIHLALEQ